MKYGVAIVWDGPVGEKTQDEAHALCICDCLAIKCREINTSMKRNGLPEVNFMIVLRDENDLPKEKKQ